MTITTRKEGTLQYKGIVSPFIIRKTEEININVATSPHRHNYYTLLWSFNKAGRHVVDTQSYPFSPQTIWFIAPGEVHCIEPPQPQGIMIQFIPEFFSTKLTNEDFLSRLDLFRSHGHPIVLSDSSSKILMSYLIAMTDAFFSSDPFRMDSIEAYLKLFLIECNKLLPQQNKIVTDEKYQHPAIATFKKMVTEHLHEWHKVNNYAEAMCLSSHYLSELFKQITDQSPKEYISTQLITEAKRMALFSGLSLKEISFSLGFEDSTHFSRFFKKRTGISFQNFRRTIII